MKIPNIEEVKQATLRAKREAEETLEAKRKAEYEEKQKRINKDSEAIVLKISTSLSEDIERAIRECRSHVTYDFSWASSDAFFTDKYKKLYKMLTESGYKVSTEIRDRDLGKADIDYWGCVEHIREVTIGWK